MDGSDERGPMRGSWLYRKNSSRASTRLSKGVLDWDVSSD